MAASLSSVLTIGMSLDGSTVGDTSLVLTLGYGIGEAIVVTTKSGLDYVWTGERLDYEWDGERLDYVWNGERLDYVHPRD